MVEIWGKPQAKQVYMIAGWRQWADAGSVSSGLPQFLMQITDADPLGVIHSDGYYLFQIPGTHDLVRPVVRFNEGYPESLETPRNEFYYSGNDERGLVIFLGDEPHMNIEQYVAAFLQAAKDLNVTRIIGLGGVYGELPYDKERMVSSNYSLRSLKEELNRYAVNLTEYHGGASIGSYICRRAGEQDLEFVGFYAFVPLYDFSSLTQVDSSIRLENDFTAWLGVLQRINHMTKLDIPISELEEKSQELKNMVDSKIDELDNLAPQMGVRDYIKRISDNFSETPFNPLDEVWEDELRRLLDKYDLDEPGS